MNAYQSETSYSLGAFGVKSLKQLTLAKKEKWENSIRILDFIETNQPQTNTNLYREVKVETDTFLVQSDFESEDAKAHQDNVAQYNRQLWEQQIDPSIYEITINARRVADNIYKDFGIPTGSWAYVRPQGRMECDYNELIGIHTKEGIEALDSIIALWENEASDYGAFPRYEAYRFPNVFGYAIDDNRSPLPYIAGRIHYYCAELEKLDDEADSPENRFKIANNGMELQRALDQLGKHINVRKDTGKTLHATLATGIKINARSNAALDVQSQQMQTANQIILEAAQQLRCSNPAITDIAIANQIHRSHSNERGYGVKKIGKLIPEWTRGGLLTPSSVRKTKKLTAK